MHKTTRELRWFPGPRNRRFQCEAGWCTATLRVLNIAARAPPGEEATLLYFAYTARIAPGRMTEVAPGAQFEFIAHLPEWGLDFPIQTSEWAGSLPTVKPQTGSTVWGAVFSVPDKEFGDLDQIEAGESRVVGSVEAMDRNGKRHQVTLHLHNGNGNGRALPSAEYLKVMLEGSRHWSLPAGWIAGLEEHIHNGH